MSPSNPDFALGPAVGNEPMLSSLTKSALRPARSAAGAGGLLVAAVGWIGFAALLAPPVATAAPPVATAAPAEGAPQAPAWAPPYRVRFKLRVIGDRDRAKTASVIAQLPTGGWLKPDGSDVAVQTATGEMLPVAVLSHAPLGDTIIQFPRRGDSPWYWAYAVADDAPPAAGEPAAEGLTVEVRQWAGDELDSWASVREGLEQSDNVIGNAVVAEVIQNCNPSRPNDPRRFAASYRGALNIRADGVYRFFLNAEDAAFLFIDGFKVTERVGSNQRLTGRVHIHEHGADVELKAGIHRFEVHHVVGNNPTALGYCALMWLPPGGRNWAFVPRGLYVPAGLAEVASIEHASGQSAAQFVSGIDDTLRSGAGSAIYLARFQAAGPVAAGDKLVWDFGDGASGEGRSLTHVYFKEGDYQVSLKSGGMPACRRSVHVWPAPGKSSPLSLGAALHSLAASNWKDFDQQRLYDMFQFVLACQQPDRWPLLDAMTERLLGQSDIDLQQKSVIGGVRMETLAQLGRASEALDLGERLLPQLKRVPSLQIGVKLEMAQIYQRHLKKPAEAEKLYEAIVNEQRRVEHPNVRIAAIRWGDLFAEAGNLTRAGECYRLAAELGGDTFAGASLTDAVTRGGLLRLAEQKMRTGDLRQTRELLERIELHYPQEKLEGMYRMLRADADRQTGFYEDALRNYEVLLQLVQWSGYKDRALYGMADTYFRLGDLPRALQWLDTLRESFPSYYRDQHLDRYRNTLVQRQQQFQAAGGANSAAAKFTGIVYDFEPQAGPAPFAVTNLGIISGLGIAGPRVALGIGSQVTKENFDLSARLKNLSGSGKYWVELWYRENLRSTMIEQFVRLDLTAINGNALIPPMRSRNLDRTFGQWRKVGFIVRSPASTDCILAVSLRGSDGVVQIGRVAVQPISDRDADALYKFIEGPETE